MTDFIWRARELLLFTAPWAVFAGAVLFMVLLIVRWLSGQPGWWWVTAPLWVVAVYLPFLYYAIRSMIGMAHL